MKNERKNLTVRIAVIGGIIVAAILVIGTIWMGQSARRDTDDAARSVSLLYLDELAGRRGQVVEETLNDDIGKIRVAVELMTDEDLSDIEHLQAYQARMKKLYDLEKFAFVDTDGLLSLVFTESPVPGTPLTLGPLTAEDISATGFLPDGTPGG